MSYFKYSTLNKQSVLASTECACIFCFKRMDPSVIRDYCNDLCPERGELVGETAICPYCSVDSIIPNSLIMYTDEDLEKWCEEGWGQELCLKNKEFIKNNDPNTWVPEYFTDMLAYK